MADGEEIEEVEEDAVVIPTTGGVQEGEIRAGEGIKKADCSSCFGQAGQCITLSHIFSK